MSAAAAPSTVLFLCTGNYYRSRFAELLFNYLAHLMRLPGGGALPYRADSAGLARNCQGRNLGPLSPHALAGLRVRGIEPLDPVRPPRDVVEEDFARARVIVALKEAEHRPLVLARFEPWIDHVRFWQVDDVQDASPATALAQIEQHVRELLYELATEIVSERRLATPWPDPRRLV
jgi:protein-tyrosine phosphatase